MKIKKYHGQTMPDVMKQIRKDLGPDAVILNTQEVQHGGLFGLFTKTKLEVVAALDPEPLQPQRKKQVQPQVEHRETKRFHVDRKEETAILQEIQQLKKMIHVKNDLNYPTEFSIVYEYLLDQEVDHHLAKQLIDQLVDHYEKEEISTNLLASRLQAQIEELLTNKFSEDPKTEKQVVHFVGPTGVGKTTTLAKVAAQSILQEKKKVAFITTDTYRIAAIDQLKTYAQILNVPIEVAYTKDDYVKAIEKFASYDLIYVDTAGRNFRDVEYIKELQEMIDLNSDTVTYLVLSLTAKQKDIIDIFNEFEPLDISEIIFTKVDETRQYGSMLTILLNNDVHVAYLTNGQDVPDDLITPTATRMSNLIMGDFSHE